MYWFMNLILIFNIQIDNERFLECIIVLIRSLNLRQIIGQPSSWPQNNFPPLFPGGCFSYYPTYGKEEAPGALLTWYPFSLSITVLLFSVHVCKAVLMLLEQSERKWGKRRRQGTHHRRVEKYLWLTKRGREFGLNLQDEDEKILRKVCLNPETLLEKRRRAV